MTSKEFQNNEQKISAAKNRNPGEGDVAIATQEFHRVLQDSVALTE
jgi:hypothetical protein